jgi:LacI family transcriptional regulator
MRLPRPVGVLASDERAGRMTLEACREAGLSAPWDVAVIATECDDLLCELSDPPLSGVVLDYELAGYRVAAILEEMMHRGAPRPRRVLVKPDRIAARASTHSPYADDAHVAAALELIHRYAARPIGIDEIVQRLPISRRSLELRFRKAVGRGPHDELQRVRLSRAQELLAETDLSIPDIAAAAGYSSASYLAQVFQRRVGRSPAQFRRAQRTSCDGDL